MVKLTVAVCSLKFYFWSDLIAQDQQIESDTTSKGCVFIPLWIMATNSQHQETPECRSFREHYSSLYHAIQDPLSLATELYSQGIIAPAVKEQMNMLGLSRLEKNSALLSAVEMKIQTDASVLQFFFSNFEWGLFHAVTGGEYAK